MDTIKIEPVPDDEEEDLKFVPMEAANTSSSSPHVHTRIVHTNPRRGKQSARRSNRYGSNRVQHYRQAWERNPMFSSWLKQGCNSRKALCVVCQSEMTADISVLKYHALCAKHIAKMATIIDDDVITSQLISLDYEPEVYKKGFYNPNWEDDKRYASWIASGESVKQAFCRICNVQLAADTGALRRHLATYSHMKAAEFDDQLQAITSIVQDKKTESIDLDSVAEDDEQVDTVMVHEINHREDDDSITLEQRKIPQPPKIGVFQSKDDRADPLERLSFIMGKFLLKGFKMLNVTCEKCECVLLQDRKKALHCIGCQYGLMEEIHTRGQRQNNNNNNNYNSLWRRSSPPPVPKIHRIRRSVERISDSVEGPLEEIFIKEEDEELTEIVINEDTSVENVVCRLVEPSTSSVEGCDVAGVDLSSEVSSLVLTLRARLATLTDQLERDLDTDSCLQDLDKTITALAKLKNL